MKNVEVLLREHVENLGKCGDVVRVRSGHARNYLFPQGLAIQANEENKRVMAQRRAQLDAEEAARNQEIEAQIERLAAFSVETEEKADESGRLYGSVNAAAIHERLCAAGFELDENDVRLEAPIKQVGAHSVRVHVHGERFAEISVTVSPEGGAPAPVAE